MLRRELLKGLAALPLLALPLPKPDKFAGRGIERCAVTVDDLQDVMVHKYRIQAARASGHCLVWNRESGIAAVPLSENGGRHFFGCVCVYPVAGHDLSPVEVTTEYRGGWLRTVDVRPA